LTILRLDHLTKRYPSGGAELTIFEDLHADFAAGEQVAVIGESGAGKSTLLHLVAGLDNPTSGAVFYKNRNLADLTEREMAAFRNQEIGYVWQQHRLLQEFTAEENVAMPLLIRGAAQGEARRAARLALDEVGLSGRVHHRAGELSGGEQQRVALARALAGGPSLLLADEPTGNLDEHTGEAIFSLLAELQRKRNLTTILVTHNPHFAAACGRTLKLESGRMHEVK
jgi:lipoprotein-releasing system ATP-binding protein